MAAPWFDIRRFGDLPRDGSADWSLVMQAAIDCLIRMYQVTGDPGTLYLPAGIYCINRPLLLCFADEVVGRYLPFSLSIVGEQAGHLADTLFGAGVIIHAHLRRINPRLTGFPRPFICSSPSMTDPCGVEGPPRLDRPALIIQGGQTVQLRNLTFCGLNHWTGALPTRESILAQHMREDPARGIDPYLIDGARDNTASPYAGVCIDPFYPYAPQDWPLDSRLRYPDLGTYYLPGPASRNVLIEDCQIHDFAVGVCLSPTGERPLGLRESETSLSLVNTTISTVKSCLSVGRHQRAAIHGGTLGPAKYAINCMDYGGPSHGPSIHGAKVSNVKHVLLTSAAGTSTTLSGLTVQDSLSLGQLSAPRLAGEAPDTVRFSGCTFEFISPPDMEAGLPAMNAHLLNCARTTFQGCRFRFPRAEHSNPPLSIANLGFLSFLDCALGNRQLEGIFDEGAAFWISGSPERVTYQGCLTTDRPRPFDRKLLTRISRAQQMPSLQEPPFLLGLATAVGMYSSHRPYTRTAEAQLHPAALQWVDALDHRILLGGYDDATLTAPGDGSAFFVVPNGVVLAGDLIATDNDIPGVLLDRDGGAPLLLGRVRAVGTAVERLTGRLVQIANLEFVPAALPQGLAELRRRGALPIQLHLVFFPRVHPPTRGKVQEGNPILTEVEIVQPTTMAKPIPLAQAWAKNHRIAGQGIPAGAYVKAVDPAERKIEISLAAMGYSGLTSLYDAPLRQISVKAM